jgi:hypothetical protein
MAMVNSNYGNGGYQNNQNGEYKKKNFRLGPKIYGADGILEIGIYNSDKGSTFCAISIKAFIGTDPGTGSSVPEQKKNSELPSVLLTREFVIVLHKYLTTTSLDQINGELDTGRGSSIKIQSQGTDVKITINNQKNGTRTITLKSLPIGAKNLNGAFEDFVERLQLAKEHMKVRSLDKDEFSAVLSGGGEASADESSEEAPF